MQEKLEKAFVIQETKPKLSKGKTVIVYRNPNAVARKFPHLEAKQ